jgi:hypothetical protein
LFKPTLNNDKKKTGTTAPVSMLLLILAVYLLSASGRIGNSDAGSMLEVSRSVLLGQLTISESATHVLGADGKPYCHYGILTSLIWMPLVLLGRLVHYFLPIIAQTQWEEFFVSFSMCFIVVALLGYLAWEWQRLGVDHRRVRRFLLVVAFSTMLWPYAKLPMSDPLMALGLFAAYCHWQRSSASLKHAWAAGLWLGIALISRKQAQAVVPVMLLAFLFMPRAKDLRARFLCLLSGIAPGVLIQLAYNQHRWGSPFLEKYAGYDSWTPPGLTEWATRCFLLFFGDYSGFFIYNMPLLIIIFLGLCEWHKTHLYSLILVIILVTTQVVFIAQFPYWSQAIGYGPRFFIYFIPFLALGAAYLPSALSPFQRNLLRLFIAIGVAVQFLGVCTDPLAAFWRRELYDRPDSSIIMARVHEFQREIGFDKTPPIMDKPNATTYWTHPAFQTPDFWWWHAWWMLREHQGRAVTPTSEYKGAPSSDMASG